ncbi:MAG: hypothetical protein Ta2E_12100 [Mycoplasmoidaceae bacterium]|nr:MAG: hypothetical protein Ta2E_12100 [Mycoplasmoidaceae bacterium]
MLRCLEDCKALSMEDTGIRLSEFAGHFRAKESDWHALISLTKEMEDNWDERHIEREMNGTLSKNEIKLANVFYIWREDALDLKHG